MQIRECRQDELVEKINQKNKNKYKNRMLWK